MNGQPNGRSELRRILEENLSTYNSLLKSLNGDFKKVFECNNNFKNSIISSINQNAIISSDPITSKLINPDKDNANLEYRNIQNLASQNTSEIIDSSIDIPIEHLNNSKFSTRFVNMKAYELEAKLNPCTGTDKDSILANLNILFALIQNKPLISQSNNRWVIIWNRPDKSIMAQQGQHRLLCHYLLGICKLNVNKCIII